MSTPPSPPLDAAEDDPSTQETAAQPGYSAADRTQPDDAEHPASAGPGSSRGEPAIAPPAQDG